MTTDLSAVYGGDEPSLIHKTLGQLTDEQDEQYRAKTFLISTYQKRNVSYAELAHRSRVLAKALLSSDLQFGDHIGIFLPSCVEHIEIFLAAARVGLPIVSFNLTFTARELADAAAFTDCKAIFICSELGPRSFKEHISLLQSLPQLQHIIQVGNDVRESSRCTPYARFSTQTPKPSIDLRIAEAQVSPTTTLNIQFTSGTTGRPKAALLTHHGMLNNAHFSSNFVNIGPNDISLQCAPLFHCLGTIGTFLMAFIRGGSLVIPSPGFDPAATLSAMIEYKATIMTGVPTMFLAVAEVAKKRGLAGKITSLRTGFVAGSPCSREHLDTMSTVLGMREPCIGYGITEVSMGTSGTHPDDSVEKRVATCGKAHPHISLRVVDKRDPSRILPRNQPGELLISSYGLFAGYYKQPEKTAEAIYTDRDNGMRWFRTGDEAKIDEEGFLIITGRIKDIIIRGGENIYPAEIEHRLAQHPRIAEACVLGLPDARYGEVVAAFLRPTDPILSTQPDSTPSNDEICSWVREKLARQKAPKHIFWLGQGVLSEVKEFPKTGSGKLQKHVLKELVLNGSGGGKAKL
ncbi:putative acyl-CoA synthetase YngI [Cyphellophora attinorum]|uniref:Putative acyl-CoA synthetase YngI n=1 Tax=Cyphellophora attinorum TaxID=1664694 RepID=A0A0N0NQ88_9EURO|nr:putative acyl-CoA synthetase YngI [Phialophora attinorum]KPI43419.1 putative acyl-CoA synthetase YngI [Phialophora attinorum]